MSENNPYQSPVEARSKPGRRTYTSFLLCCLAGIVAASFPLVHGWKLYSQVFTMDPDIPQSGTSVMGGMVFMVIFAPVIGLVVTLGLLIVRWIYQWKVT